MDRSVGRSVGLPWAGTSTEVLFRQESNFLFLSGFDHEEALLVVGLRPVGHDRRRNSRLPKAAAATAAAPSSSLGASSSSSSASAAAARRQRRRQLAPGDGWLFIEQGDPVWGGGWLGTLPECAEIYGVQQCFWATDLAATMLDLAPASVYTLPGVDLPDGALPPGSSQVTTGLAAGLSAARVVKTEEELQVK